MKRIFSICLMLTLLAALPITALAAGSKVVFKSGSSFKVGGTATVDFLKTSENVMNDDNVMADMYNAALEQNMDVMWRCSNGPDKYGNPVTWTAADAGKEYVCRVGFYSDDECTQLIDYIDSEVFTISGGQTSAEPKLTPEGPFYLTVGEYFEQKISCNVSGVTIQNFRTSLPSGLEITDEGLIYGTPTKEGFWFTTIAAFQGEEMIADLGAEFYVSAVAAPKITTTSLPDAVIGQDYYVKIQCTDPNAEIGEHYIYDGKNEFRDTGLTISSDGEIEGKPMAAGTFTFSIRAVNGGGQDSKTYTLTVREKAPAVTEPTEEPTTEPTEETVDATNTPTEETKPTAAAKPAKDKQQSNKSSGNVWTYVGVGLGAVVVGLGVAIVFLLKPKKK